MKQLLFVVMLLAMGAQFALADHHAVKVVKNEALGSFLTDTKGMTLYYFKKDSANNSACAGDCVTRWPLYFRESVAAKDGLKNTDFGIITRDDGKKQSTYKGMPLYYFFKDLKPGDTTGQGVNNVWYVVAP